MQSKVDNEMELLQASGAKLNEILSGRAKKAVDAEKEKGKDYVASFLLSHPKAVQTQSGLVYDEIIAGVGAKPTATSTVEDIIMERLQTAPSLIVLSTEVSLSNFLSMVSSCVAGGCANDGRGLESNFGMSELHSVRR